MRRCLDCPKFVGSGSRCARCRQAFERKRMAGRGQTRSGYERLAWPALIKRRDGWRCWIAGCPTPQDRIQAHHIKPVKDGGGYELSNGITLCHEHHRQAHRELAAKQKAAAVGR